MTIASRLDADLKQALRARDAVRTSTICLARAAFQNAEIDRRRPLTEAEAVEVIQREVKRRREAIEAFERGGRTDLVQTEQLEMAILLGYLPPALTPEEIRQVVADVEDAVFIGELALTGDVRPVRGLLPMVMLIFGMIPIALGSGPGRLFAHLLVCR